MLTFDAPTSIRFAQCDFTHADTNKPTINITDNGYTTTAPLTVVFERCVFGSQGPAVVVSVIRPNSVVSIDFIDTKFNNGDPLAPSKVAVVVDMSTTATVTVRQTVSQMRVVSFVGVATTSSLLAVTGASLVLDNVDFGPATSGGAVATTRAHNVTVTNCRFNSLAAHALKLDFVSGATLNVTGSTFQTTGARALDATSASSVSVTNSVFDSCQGGAIATGESDAVLRNLVIRNGTSSSFGVAVQSSPSAMRDVLIENCTFASNSGQSDMIEFSGLTDKAPTITNCRFEKNAMQTSAIVSSSHGLKVLGSSFTNNSAQYQVYASSKELLVQDVTFAGSRAALAASPSQPFDICLLSTNSRGEFANVTASQSGVGSLFSQSDVHFVRGASRLRAIVLEKPVVVNVTVPVTLALCDTMLPTVERRQLGAALVGKVGDQLLVPAGGELSVMRATNCEAFASGGSGVVNGTLALRSFGGAFNLSRTFSGTGTLKLGIRGADVAKGEVDHAIFTQVAKFGALDVTVGISSMAPVGTVITALTFPRDSNFGTLPTFLNITETTISYTVLIACTHGCNNGICVATDKCTCNEGWADSATAKCNMSLATSMSGLSQPASTTGGGGQSTVTQNAVAPSPSLPIEIIAPAAAGGLLLIVCIIVIVCCVVRKRKTAQSAQSGGKRMESPREQSGAYSTGGGGSVTYGSLPSDAERITSATGKEVVAVEWEEGSSEE